MQNWTRNLLSRLAIAFALVGLTSLACTVFQSRFRM